MDPDITIAWHQTLTAEYGAKWSHPNFAAPRISSFIFIEVLRLCLGWGTWNCMDAWRCNMLVFLLHFLKSYLIASFLGMRVFDRLTGVQSCWFGIPTTGPSIKLHRLVKSTANHRSKDVVLDQYRAILVRVGWQIAGREFAEDTVMTQTAGRLHRSIMVYFNFWYNWHVRVITEAWLLHTAALVLGTRTTAGEFHGDLQAVGAGRAEYPPEVLRDCTSGSRFFQGI